MDKLDPAGDAIADRPELKQSALAVELANAQTATARSALYPQIVARAAFEADRGQFVRQAGASWFFGASLRWNIYTGNADRARIDEASHMAASAQAQKRAVESGIRLEVKQARSALDAATQRIQVAAASISEAEESLRIMQNRYDNGLSTVTDLLGNETALLDARMRKLAAIYDQRVAAAMLELAAGRLAGDSYVLD
jgi:outer membrane protein TolC